MIRKTIVSNEDLRVAIELGWDGPDSSMTMDELIAGILVMVPYCFSQTVPLK